MPPHNSVRRRLLPFAVVCLLAAGLLAAPDISRARVIDQLLAVVNGKTIALSDVVHHRLLFAPELSGEALRQRVIDHRIVLEEAARFELQAPQATRVNDVIAQLQRAFGTAAQWRSALQRVGLEPADVEPLVVEHLSVESFLVQRVDLFVFVSPAEVTAAHEEDERFRGRPLEEVEQALEQELLNRKITEKRREYVARLRSRATIRQLADVPDNLPSRPLP